MFVCLLNTSLANLPRPNARSLHSIDEQAAEATALHNM